MQQDEPLIESAVGQKRKAKVPSDALKAQINDSEALPDQFIPFTDPNTSRVQVVARPDPTASQKEFGDQRAEEVQRYMQGLFE